ncbi:MAG: citrate synthase [Solobacterium sp.]|nr:citrate synthase [Solobacterium sp.]
MIYPEVAKLNQDEILRLCREYRKNNFIDPEISEALNVKRGLRNADGSGVLAGLTNIADARGYRRDEKGTLIPTEGKLVYRGIDIETLVDAALNEDRFMFEETVWLLMFGSLPTRPQLERFCHLLEEHRDLPDGFAETMIMGAPSPDIMNKMARSVLAMYSYDDKAEDTTLENIINQSINLVAQIPTMMIYAYQTKRHVYEHKTMYFHFPTPGQSTAEHILSTYRITQDFTHEEAKLLDLCLMVHADHGGGNNSAFTDRVISSTGTDTYSAIAGALVSLKGPKHGGANRKVIRQTEEMMRNIEDTDDPKQVKEYLKKILCRVAGDGSGLIYGVGHAVYTLSDPRARLLRKHAEKLSYQKGFGREYRLLCMIADLAPEAFREVKGTKKPICANVDLFSGLIFKILGIEEDLFTPIFAIARCAGWCAHRMEEVEFSNRIIRPAYKYVGGEEDYIPIDNR